MKLGQFGHQPHTCKLRDYFITQIRFELHFFNLNSIWVGGLCNLSLTQIRFKIFIIFKIYIIYKIKKNQFIIFILKCFIIYYLILILKGRSVKLLYYLPFIFLKINMDFFFHFIFIWKCVMIYYLIFRKIL